MKDVEIQQQFVALRAKGKSFAAIAHELNVSKGALINWSRRFQFEIQNLRAIELEALQEQLIATRETRARALAEQLACIEQELKKRDLANVSTGRLHGLANSLRQQILRETGQIKFTSPLKEIPDDEYYE
jgi:transposase